MSLSIGNAKTFPLNLENICGMTTLIDTRFRSEEAMLWFVSLGFGVLSIFCSSGATCTHSRGTTAGICHWQAPHCLHASEWIGAESPLLRSPNYAPDTTVPKRHVVEAHFSKNSNQVQNDHSAVAQVPSSCYYFLSRWYVGSEYWCKICLFWLGSSWYCLSFKLGGWEPDYCK